jgi:hypothetical protein
MIVDSCLFSTNATYDRLRLSKSPVAMDWNNDIEPRNQSKVIEFGNIEIKVLFESDKQIYLQSEKGIKLIKPEPDFLELLNPVLR